MSRQVEQYVSASYNNFREKAAHGTQSVGGLLNSTIVLINLLNLQTSIDTLRSLPEESKQYRKAWEDLSISFLWTLHAIGTTTESAAKYWLGRNTSTNLLEFSLKDAVSRSHSKATRRVTSLLVKGIAVGCVAGIAAVMWESYRDIKRILSEDDDPVVRSLLAARVGTILTQSVAWTTYFINAFVRKLPYSMALPIWLLQRSFGEV